MTRQCFSSISAASAFGCAPFSIASEKCANESAKMEHSTVLTSETLTGEPTARNSKRWPPYGKGEVRLRSSAGTWKGAIAGMPRSTVFPLSDTYGFASCEFLKASRYAETASPM